MPNTMRVAIAGTGGLAVLIAHYIHAETSHQLIILSRSAQPGLVSQGYQVQTVDYNDAASIQHALSGVDTVISTVLGPSQLRLIEAAVQVRVRRFAPAEFEGRPALREANDPLDRGKAAALAHLQYYRSYIESTTFVCGILYERFSPNGMVAHRIGVRSGIGNEGDYVADIRNMTAQAPAYGSADNLATVCMTAAQDVGRFVVRALDMDHWPAELSMRGERIAVSALITLIQQVRGRQWTNCQWHNPNTLGYEITMAQMQGDLPKELRLRALLATANGKYDFGQPYLNAQFPNIQPIAFRDWLTRSWAGIP